MILSLFGQVWDNDVDLLVMSKFDYLNFMFLNYNVFLVYFFQCFKQVYLMQM